MSATRDDRLTADILVVDDEAVMRDLVAKILTRAGFAVSTAVDGPSALAHLEQSAVDLVISDVKMPGMTGFDLLTAIKRERPEILVIMMTAYGDLYTVKDAMLLGADEYITKPFKSHELALIVERALWRRRANQPVPASE